MHSEVEAFAETLDRLRQEVNDALESLIQEELKLGAGEVAREAGRMLNAGGKRLRPILFMLA